MTRMDFVKMQLRYNEEKIGERKAQMEWYMRNMQEEFDRGYLRLAAEWADKVARAGYEIDILEKAMKDFKELLRELEKEDE